MPIQGSGGIVGGVALDATVQTLATQATLSTASTTLASILAKMIAAPADAATLAAAKADLDALNVAVATAAKQDTGNTTLATLSTNLSALVAADHADLATLHADVSAQHADLAAILAKQPTAPTIEGGHIATVDASTATLAATVSGGKVLTTETSAAAAAASAATSATQNTTTATKTTAILTALGGLPATLGPAAAGSALVVTMASPSEFNQATLAATGAQIVSAAARIYLLHAVNTGIAAIFLFLFNATSAVATGGLSVFESTTLAVAGGLQNAFGTLGIYCSAGLRIDASATGGATGYTQSVGTTTVKTSISYV